MTQERFRAQFDVPRGTLQDLEAYEALLIDWQSRLNLVGPATLVDVWGRHFADSAQLIRLIPNGKHWLDVGSGGGFPGLVLAVMRWGRFTLVDSVAKKTRFLEAVRDALALPDVAILNARVEALPTMGVEVATARAAAPLATLFDWTIRHVRPGGTWVFPKGRRWADEVADAEQLFRFDYEAIPSITDPEARIILARNLKRR